MNTSAAHRAQNTLEEGTRVGRYVMLRDIEGAMHAISATSVSVLREDDGDTLLLLPGGRTIRTSRPLAIVLTWLDLRG